MNTAQLKKQYKEQIVPALQKQFNYSSAMQVPVLKKIVINQGLGDATQDKKIIEVAVNEISSITGQKAVATYSKKDIANFKLRKKMPIGVMVTLRRERMYEFLEKLVRVSLPRIRDFKGIESKFDFRVVTGIPDKNFSVPQGTESGTAYNGQYLHKFIYVPAYGLDGKVWLNNNLGANYSNVNSPVFSPGKQASSPTDFNAYGSLFRSGHEAYTTLHKLGHELVNWTNATTGTAEITSLSWNHSHFPPIYASKFTEYCPDGFKTPTVDDWGKYGGVLAQQTVLGLVKNEFWNDFSLRLTAAGSRDMYKGVLFHDQSSIGNYWSSTVYYDRTGAYTNGVFQRNFGLTYADVNNKSIFNGYSIRCIWRYIFNITLIQELVNSSVVRCNKHVILIHSSYRSHIFY